MLDEARVRDVSQAHLYNTVVQPAGLWAARHMDFLDGASSHSSGFKHNDVFDRILRLVCRCKILTFVGDMLPEFEATRALTVVVRDGLNSRHVGMIELTRFIAAQAFERLEYLGQLYASVLIQGKLSHVYFGVAFVFGLFELSVLVDLMPESLLIIDPVVVHKLVFLLFALEMVLLRDQTSSGSDLLLLLLELVLNVLFLFGLEKHYFPLVDDMVFDVEISSLDR